MSSTISTQVPMEPPVDEDIDVEKIKSSMTVGDDDDDDNVTTTTSVENNNSHSSSSSSKHLLPQKRSKSRRDKRPKAKRNRKRPDHPNDEATTLSNLNMRIVSIDVDDDAPPMTTTTTTTTESKNSHCHDKESVLHLRMIEPYPYTFLSYAKARWVGRTILDVYSSEFRSYPASYYRHAIEQGHIQVGSNRQKNNNSNHGTTTTNRSSSRGGGGGVTTVTHHRTVSCDYCIQGSDVLSHTVHRHEPAVQITQTTPPYVKVVAETPDVLCVDKPGTMPVHPCGGYHQNSLIPLLERALYHHDDDDDGSSCPNKGNNSDKTPPPSSEPKEEQQQCSSSSSSKLYTIHRLDRLTSGLVILAKRSAVARDWAQAIQERSQCTKLYLARVRGRFPQQATALKNLPRLAPEQKEGQLPLYGEWRLHQHDCDSSSTNNTKKQSSKADRGGTPQQARIRNAYGWWITTTTNGTTPLSQTDTNQSNDGDVLVSHDMSLDQFSRTPPHSLEDWLKALNPATAAATATAHHTVDTGEATNESALPASSSSSSSRSLFWLHLACPVRNAHTKDGVCESGTFDNLNDATYLKTVKPAHTSFAILHYDEASDSTVVLCRPLTGRTHQIRVHLRHLGHPIANDPCYGGDLWYADPAGAKACQEARQFLTTMDQEVAADKKKATTSDTNSNSSCPKEEKGSAPVNAAAAVLPRESLVTTDVPATEEEIKVLAQQLAKNKKRNDGVDESQNEFIQRTCVWCARSGGRQEERTKMEFLARSRGIWLHALQYHVQFVVRGGTDNTTTDHGQKSEMCFSTEPPAWSRLG